MVVGGVLAVLTFILGLLTERWRERRAAIRGAADRRRELADEAARHVADVTSLVREVPETSQAWIAKPEDIWSVAGKLNDGWTRIRRDIVEFAIRHPDPPVRDACADVVSSADELVRLTVEASRMRVTTPGSNEELLLLLDSLRGDTGPTDRPRPPAVILCSYDAWSNQWARIQECRSTVMYGLDVAVRAVKMATPEV
jgi:hypothetical protein